ncbi:uridine kinase [Thiospirochaeta perfilievii]|uniref:Uridine kinase n=1 Tax=Thiospirochaeta perfilievii TaxID=252967 RepID=A0A5C1QGB2_9SPIO|nr:uridine kinase [Thiospirochaeta perfilievii]QEN06398.1 uridine kinase [Thiospirochaeta perfilievii]
MKDKVTIVGITGGSGSGKTTIVKKIEEIVSEFVFIPQDNYYKTATYVNNNNITSFNFDHPDAFDSDLLLEQLQYLKDGKSIEMPEYDFVNHSRVEKRKSVNSQTVVIIEGIMLFWDKRIRDLLDLKIFVDTPDDIRFIRRLTRDVKERGRTLDSVVTQYLDIVRPGYYEFIEPTKSYADIIIPEGGFNQNALQVLVSYLKDLS